MIEAATAIAQPIRDEALEAWLLSVLDGVDVLDFVPPTAPMIRTAAEIRDILRPSSMGGCERALTLKVGSLPFAAEWSAKAQTAVDFGTAVHRRVQALLPGRHEVPAQGPWLRGTADTVLNQTVPDYKTINHRGFLAVKKAGKPEQGHWDQATWYARHLGKPRAAVVYFDKAETESGPQLTISSKTMLAFAGDVPDGDHPYDLKADRVRAHLDRGTLPDFEESRACMWCPVKILCWRARPSEELRTIASKVVGTTFRPPETQAALEALTQGQDLRLEHEPDNQFDIDAGRTLPGTKLAVAVKVCWGALHLGYLPAEGAAGPVADHLYRGGTALCHVAELTGKTEGKENRGVNLTLTLT